LNAWLIARFWHNGGKLSLAVVALGIVAVALTANSFCRVLSEEPEAPIQVRAPFEVSVSPIEQGGNLVMLTDFCNDAGEDVEVTYVGRYVQIGPEGLPVRSVEGSTVHRDAAGRGDARLVVSHLGAQLRVQGAAVHPGNPLGDIRGDTSWTVTTTCSSGSASRCVSLRNKRRREQQGSGSS
jgi:hypothetical protein